MPERNYILVYLKPFILIILLRGNLRVKGTFLNANLLKLLKLGSRSLNIIQNLRVTAQAFLIVEVNFVLPSKLRLSVSKLL